MIIDTVLRRLDGLERALAELYEWYSEVLWADAEAVYVFLRMSREEKGHARLVDYQRRILQKDASLSIDVEVDLAGLEALVEKTKALRAGPVLPTVEEALRETIGLELTAAEVHYRHALGRVRPEVARLLSALGEEDRLHLERIQDMMRHRRIVVPHPPVTRSPGYCPGYSLQSTLVELRADRA